MACELYLKERKVSLASFPTGSSLSRNSSIDIASKVAARDMPNYKSLHLGKPQDMVSPSGCFIIQVHL